LTGENAVTNESVGKIYWKVVAALATIAWIWFVFHAMPALTRELSWIAYHLTPP
jgi:hypothetical protein